MLRVKVLALICLVFSPQQTSCRATDFFKNIGDSVHKFNQGILGGVQNLENRVHDKFNEFNNQKIEGDSESGPSSSVSAPENESKYKNIFRDTFKTVGEKVNNIKIGVSDEFKKITKGVKDKFSEITHSHSQQDMIVPANSEKESPDSMVNSDKIEFPDGKGSIKVEEVLKIEDEKSVSVVKEEQMKEHKQGGKHQVGKALSDIEEKKEGDKSSHEQIRKISHEKAVTDVEVREVSTEKTITSNNDSEHDSESAKSLDGRYGLDASTDCSGGKVSTATGCQDSAI